MPQAIIVFSILALVVVVYWLCTSKKFTQRSSGQDSKEEASRKKNKQKEASTGFVPVLIIDQITRKGLVLESFEVSTIPENGITISRPGAEAGDIILSDKSKDAMTIGTEGIIIGKDEQGIFGKVYENGHKKNKLYIYNKKTNDLTETKQFDITDGTVICMGSQWLKFQLPSSPEHFSFVPEVSQPVQRTNYTENQLSGDFNPIPDKKRENYASSASTSQQRRPAEKTSDNNSARNSAPSGFSFETVIDENGRFVIKKD